MNQIDTLANKWSVEITIRCEEDRKILVNFVRFKEVPKYLYFEKTR